MRPVGASNFFACYKDSFPLILVLIYNKMLFLNMNWKCVFHYESAA